jgi:hypothetical protein
MSSVWVQLYYKGEANSVGEADPFEIQPIPEDVDALKIKVRERFAFGSPAVLLKVYASGTPVPILKGTGSLDPGNKVPADTTSKTPLIVIAPKPEPQNGKLRCCFRIHFCIQMLLRIGKFVAIHY